MYFFVHRPTIRVDEMSYDRTVSTAGAVFLSLSTLSASAMNALLNRRLKIMIHKINLQTFTFANKIVHCKSNK